MNFFRYIANRIRIAFQRDPLLTAPEDKNQFFMWSSRLFVATIVAITISAGVSITASLIVLNQTQEQRDRDFDLLCGTVQRTSALASLQAREQALANDRAAGILRRSARRTSVPGPLNAVADAFDRAARFGDVVADAKLEFAESDCRDLPPPPPVSIEQLRERARTNGGG